MLTCTFHFKDAGRQLQELVERIEERGVVHQLISEVMLGRTRDRFQNETAPDGSKWQPLSQITLANRQSPSGILRDSGELFRSIHKKADASKAQVGTNLNHPKVMVHQHGAVITPKSARALMIPGGKGANRPVFAKSVTIPARQYIGFGPDDEPAIIEALVDYLEG